MPKINLGKVIGEKGKPFTYEDFTQEQLDGLTPKILKGDVTTLDPDQNATVSIRKEGVNNYIDFGIPRGKNGAEIKSISSENVTMTDGENLENTAATLKNNIDELTTPTFTDTVSTYTTLNDANDAAETAGNAIKSKVNIFTTLSNMKQSFSAIIQGLKILATNVGAINGITSDINSESDSIAASSKMVHDLNSKLSYKRNCYHSIGMLGITSTFIPDIIDAMPDNSTFIATSPDIFANSQNKIPINIGVLTIEKTVSNRIRVICNYCSSSASYGHLYLASINTNTKVVNGWYDFSGTLLS